MNYPGGLIQDVLSSFSSDPSVPATSIRQVFESALVAPYLSYFNRPHKKFRRQMVEAGFHLFLKDDEENVPSLEEMGLFIEEIHLGSLIVDDIQDGSMKRRGELTLHRQIGLPLSLNFGNWLYFRALRRIALLNVTDSVRSRILDSVTWHLEKAHWGQALDLGSSIEKLPNDDLVLLVEESLRLKSGCLMALALEIGAHLSQAHFEWDKLRDFGMTLGSCLQKLDDIGNAISNDEKELEDLYLMRPNYLYVLAAEELSSADQEHWRQQLAIFREAPHQLSRDRLKEFLFERGIISIGKAKVSAQLDRLLENMLRELTVTKENKGFQLLQQICERLKNAYTK